MPPSSNTPYKRKLSEPTPACVYFLDCQGFTKIGRSEYDPNLRLRDLQSANPFPITVIGCIETDYAPELEYQFHKEFAEFRTSGEWFKLPPEVLESIKSRFTG